MRDVWSITVYTVLLEVLLGELLSRIKLKRMGYKHGKICMCVQHLWDF